MRKREDAGIYRVDPAAIYTPSAAADALGTTKANILKQIKAGRLRVHEPFARRFHIYGRDLLCWAIGRDPDEPGKPDAEPEPDEPEPDEPIGRANDLMRRMARKRKR